MDLAAEDARIAHHIAGAEAALRARNHPLLDVLEDYRRERRYPRNRSSRAWTPVFIDEDGTRCAMAHLLEHVGAHDFVQRVGRTHNLARIHDLRDDLELRGWLLVLGISLEEAARIQPTYCARRASCYCAYEDRTIAVAEGTAIRGDGGEFSVHIDVVHRGGGVAPGSIIPLRGTPTPAPQKTLVSVNGGDEPEAFSLPLDAISPIRCADALAGLPPLTKDEIVNAAGIGCTEILAARDPRFYEMLCDDTLDGGIAIRETGPPDAPAESGVLRPAPDVGVDASASTVQQDGGGCAFAPHPSHAALATLVVATYLLRRRRGGE